MSEQIGQRNKWRDLYRLVILREETLEEVNSYKLTMLNIYIFISTVLVLLVGLVFCIIFYTPIKKLVPGYGDPSENPAYAALYNRVQDMEKQLSAYEIYTNNFRKLITPSDSFSFEKASIPPRLDDLMNERGGASDNFSDPEERYDNSDWEIEDHDATNNVPLRSTGTNEKPLAHLYLIPPLVGPISSGFNAEIDHFGVDILAPKDTPVKAILDGHVVASDWTLEAGNTIGIQHSNNIFSFYKHNAILLKKPGSFVHAGEAIALVGNTGKFTTGPHLHFELWQNGIPIDPEQYINFK